MLFHRRCCLLLECTSWTDNHVFRVCHRVVEFATYSEMRRAIDKLDNTELNGRRVRLIEDKQTKRRQRLATVPCQLFCS